MTQFAGYVLSGSVFIAFGLKFASLDATSLHAAYTIEDTRSCSSSKQKRRCPAICKLSFWPLQGLIKVGVASLGLGACLVSCLHGDYDVGNFLYATIYLMFALSGLVDVLFFYCPLVVPWGLDNFALSLAFIIEGLVFSLHKSHESLMEQQMNRIITQHVHLLLVVVVFANAMNTLLEIVMPWSRIIRFTRAYFTFLHGSWLIQSGFILYIPNQSSLTWSSSDEYNSALIWVTLTYSWHCAGALVILLILMGLSYKQTPTLPPQIEPFDAEHRPGSSIPRCHFSSLSNCGDLKA